jgi:tRNA threonylcarbamoyladenosine biosynthesis protein TsaE
METILSSTKETEDLARKIAKKLKPNDVLALYGDLGSGKTAFTRFLVGALGITAHVQSPTFVIVRKYQDEIHKRINCVNHIDLYRLTETEQVTEIDLEMLINSKSSVTIIEWPELAEQLLPKRTIKIIFEELSENERQVYVQNLY